MSDQEFVFVESTSFDWPYRTITETELQHVLGTRGYWVVWSVVQWAIGTILRPDDALTDQRFVIVAETDKCDHDEQLRLLGESPIPMPFSQPFHFYRVATD